MRKQAWTLATAKKVEKMLLGESIPASSLPLAITHILLEEGIVVPIVRGSKTSYRIQRVDHCKLFIENYFTEGVSLNDWIKIKSQENVTRAEQVQAGLHSKVVKSRSFKGFLIASYQPVEAELKGNPFSVYTPDGISLFVQDYESFSIPKDVVVVGIENGENFQRIWQQKYLFGSRKILFVSRYPQSSDLLQWLGSISNSYLHFGDFDLAGVQIFQTEFYSKLGKRAQFFIPKDIESRLIRGSRLIYDQQLLKYQNMQILDERVHHLVELIHTYRRGYEQEGYII